MNLSMLAPPPTFFFYYLSLRATGTVNRPNESKSQALSKYDS
jgi:hypothetical protein